MITGYDVGLPSPHSSKLGIHRSQNYWVVNHGEKRKAVSNDGYGEDQQLDGPKKQHITRLNPTLH